jgi:hypothetical protein
MTISAKTFTALAAAATRSRSLRDAHCVIIAPVGPAYASPGPTAANGNVSASWTVGAGMCVAFESAFKNHKQRQ